MRLCQVLRRHAVCLAAAEHRRQVRGLRRHARAMPQFHPAGGRCRRADRLQRMFRCIGGKAGDHRHAPPGKPPRMVPDQMGEDVLPAPGFGQARGIDVQFGTAALIAVQPGIGREAGQRAGHVKVVAILVGPRPHDGVVVGDGIGFADRNVVAKLRPARQLVGRAGPCGLCSQPLVKMHQRGGALHHLRVFGHGPQRRVGEAHDAIVGPGLHRQRSTVLGEEAHEIHMRLTGVETRIEMREANRDQPFRPHDLGGLDHQPRGQLHGRAMLAGKLRAGLVGKLHP